MNRNEFYKQLMSEYTFDAEKIRENAKHGKKRQKLSPLYIGMTAAAAATVVTVGTIAMTNLGKDHGVSLTDTGLTTLSASDRLNHALEQIEQERESSESKDFLVTFAQPMTPAQAQSVLTSGGNIPVKQLYLSDGSRISDADQIGKIFTGGGDQRITGAAVYCSGSFAAELQDDPSVFLIEVMEASDFENAAPVDISEIQTTEVTLPQPEMTEPVVVPPATSAVIPTEEPGMDGTAEPTEETSEMDGTAEPETVDVPLTEEDEGLPTEETTTVPEETTAPPETSGSSSGDITPDEPGEHIPSVPSGVTLPANIDPENYNTYITADTAFFISSDVFIVKDSQNVSLYRYDGVSETLICTEPLEDAKVAWVSENGRNLMMTGIGDFGNRSRTLLISADSESIVDLSTEDTIISGALTGFGYNENSRLLCLCFKEDGVYYIAAARLSTDNTLDYIGIPVESEEKLALVASDGDTIYYAETISGKTTIYSADAVSGSGRLVHSFSSAPKLTRNLAFTHAVFTPDENAVIGFTEIFDPATGRLIPVAGSSVSFGASRHSFLDGNSCFSINDGAAAADGSISSLAKIEYRRSGSEKWYAYVSGGTVRITESTYSSENINGLLTFSDITSNASDELVSVVRGAIGVNNALALGKCRECGITDTQSLIDCINAFYSANTSQKLMTKCGITPLGALSYSSGGLSGIDAGSTLLVVSERSDNSCSGMLYIESGTFGGRLAYRSIPVSFVKENDVWKLDTILK